MRTEHKTVAELFAGIGLMRLGLDQAGWKTIWANDIDADKEAMYRHQFTDADNHFVLACRPFCAAESPAFVCGRV